ncbi:MAG: endo-1,4-beta-xylanase [Candidatus Sulfotelmatobacter sp.]
MPFKSTLKRIVLAALFFSIALPVRGAGPPKQAPGLAAETLRQAGATHNLIIGAAASSRYLSEPDYAAVLGTEFSQLQAENEMKFAVIHPRPNADLQPYDFSRADALVAFAQNHNMLVRGHTLVWHKQVPKWISEGSYTPPELANILLDHTTTVMNHFGSKVYAWDVVNEAFNDDGSMRNSVWYNQPGIGFAGSGTRYIEQALEWAHAANPNAKLFYNDYDAETINQKSDAIYAMAKDFKKRGVPLDGIGFQTHITLNFDNPEKLASYARNLKRFAKLGLDLHITELDIRLNDSSAASLKQQAKLYAEITQLCFRQRQCKVLQTWGFTDKHSWIPGFFPGMDWALMWDANYAKKPAYSAVEDALEKR